MWSSIFDHPYWISIFCVSYTLPLVDLSHSCRREIFLADVGCKTGLIGPGRAHQEIAFTKKPFIRTLVSDITVDRTVANGTFLNVSRTHPIDPFVIVLYLGCRLHFRWPWFLLVDVHSLNLHAFYRPKPNRGHHNHTGGIHRIIIHSCMLASVTLGKSARGNKQPRGLGHVN